MRYDDRISSVESDDRVLFEEQADFEASLYMQTVELPPFDLFETEAQYTTRELEREEWQFKGLWESHE